MVRSEPLPAARNPEQLWIAGDNPLSRIVTRLAESVEFQVSVFPEPPSQMLGQALFTSGAPAPRCGIVLLDSMEHQIAVLQHWLDLPFSFLGLAGTREQKAAIVASLGNTFSREQLERIHCPLGLKIGAVSPDEIAISIVAQLVQNRSDRRISHEAASRIRSPLE